MLNSIDARAKSVFDEVIDLHGDDRLQRLNQSCADSPELRARVETLLAAAEKDDSFLGAPTLNTPSPSPEQLAGEQPGAQIGPYMLVKLLGEGGFGSVFLAEQSAPVRRQVALKIIKAGMDTKQVIARFEAERQTLALMEHPNIARVLEAGATAAGRPYFVMELVAGDPVTRYCDSERLSVSERLGLFCDICNAVQHAHQKGVIHRDLKPSNILVTNAGGAPVVKVIDFGIAKATAAQPADATLTGQHQLIGTPEYMSPEQAQASADIDTRSDIYSLGALLYELMTGATPFERERLASSGFDGMRKIIRDEKPLRPSARVKTVGSSVALVDKPAMSAESKSSVIEIAGRRRSEPVLLARTLRRDLDWIVLKCLEKERARRYESASALADDIRRYLRDLPVVATPPSARYRLHKFISRNRVGVVAGTLVALTLMIATGVSIALAVQTSRALKAAEKNWSLAQKRADETRQVAQYQSSLLSEIDPQQLGRAFKELFREQVKAGLARESVGEWPNRRKRTAEQVDAELATYDHIVEPVQAVDVARRVFDRYLIGDQIDTVSARFAEQPYIQTELLHTLGVVAQLLGIYDKAESALQRSRELRESGVDNDDVALAETISRLGEAIASQGKFDEAERLQREAYALFVGRLGKDHYKSINCLNLVAMDLSSQGEYAAAAALLREVLPAARLLPPEQEQTLGHVLHNLGGALFSHGETDAAEPFAREALEIRRKEKNRLDLGDALNNLAGIAYSRRHYDESWKLLNEALEIKRLNLGDEHIEIATLVNNLASIRYKLGDRAGAKTLFAEALAIYRQQLGDENNEVVGTLNNLAMMYQKDGELAVSGPMLREALELRRRLLPADHPDVGLSLANLAEQLEAEGDLAAAEPYYREAVEIYSAKYAPCQGRRVAGELACIRVQIGLRRFDEAEQLLLGFYTEVEKIGPGAACRGDYLKELVKLYERRQDAAPDGGFDHVADEWRAKLAEWRTTTQPAKP